jgi:peptidoglycan/LPS O-acetylase OafA/YrhL
MTAGAQPPALSDQTAGATDRTSAGESRKSPGDGFRPDIEGLRAVALVAVLLYHAGLSFVPGGYVGVDVFFVISGFLITGLLLREIEKTGTLSIMRFYSRRAKRLLPMTVVVLGTAALVSWLLFSPVRMDKVSFDIIGAGLYLMNWRLAIQAADYFAAGLQASPVQHFWTLAVEEQFYLVWPALVLSVAWW